MMYFDCVDFFLATKTIGELLGLNWKFSLTHDIYFNSRVEQIHSSDRSLDGTRDIATKSFIKTQNSG